MEGNLRSFCIKVLPLFKAFVGKIFAISLKIPEYCEAFFSLVAFVIYGISLASTIFLSSKNGG